MRLFYYFQEVLGGFYRINTLGSLNPVVKNLVLYAYGIY